MSGSTKLRGTKINLTPFPDIQFRNEKFELQFLLMNNHIAFRANPGTKEVAEVDEKIVFIKRALNHRKNTKILAHPLVAAYLYLKWQSLSVYFYVKWSFFIASILVPMTLMTAMVVEMNQCEHMPCKDAATAIKL